MDRRTTRGELQRDGAINALDTNTTYSSTTYTSAPPQRPSARITPLSTTKKNRIQCKEGSQLSTNTHTNKHTIRRLHSEYLYTHTHSLGGTHTHSLQQITQTHEGTNKRKEDSTAPTHARPHTHHTHRERQ